MARYSVLFGYRNQNTSAQEEWCKGETDDLREAIETWEWYQSISVFEKPWYLYIFDEETGETLDYFYAEGDAGGKDKQEGCFVVVQSCGEIVYIGWTEQKGKYPKSVLERETDKLVNLMRYAPKEIALDWLKENPETNYLPNEFGFISDRCLNGYFFSFEDIDKWNDAVKNKKVEGVTIDYAIRIKSAVGQRFTDHLMYNKKEANNFAKFIIAQNLDSRKDYLPDIAKGLCERLGMVL